MVSEWNQIIGTVKAIGIWDILDIVIVALLIYQVIKLIRETRAMQLAKGLILLLLLYFVAYNLNMKTVRFIMQNVVATGVLALVIVFQPELRRMLEHVAQTKLNKLNIFQSSQDKDSELTGVWNESISVIANACETLSKTKTGALIVFERQTKLGEIIKTGTVVDATPSNELIGNLFFGQLAAARRRDDYSRRTHLRFGMLLAAEPELYHQQGDGHPSPRSAGRE